MADAWVYIDESQAPFADAVDAGMPFRVGVLVVEAPIPASIPQAGIERLRADPDAKGNKLDEETLRRGHFHASEDSPNAHSALTHAICDAGLDASFLDLQWHFGLADSNEYDGKKLHSLMNGLGSLPATQDDYDTVHLLVAKRKGSFDEEQIRGWPESWLEMGLQAFAKHPNIPMRFPRIRLSLVGGDEPGVQICDFLLWSVQRARLENLAPTGEQDWMKRLGLSARMGGGPVGGAQQEANLTLGRGVERWFMPNMTGGIPRALDRIEKRDLLELMREIEVEVLRVAAISPGHPRIGHLESHLRDAASRLANPTGLDDIVKVAAAFLLCCDTLPTYDPADASNYVHVIERRRIAAAVVDKSNQRWFSMGRFWLENR
jgi:hypothetical protein